MLSPIGFGIVSFATLLSLLAYLKETLGFWIVLLCVNTCFQVVCKGICTRCKATKPKFGKNSRYEPVRNDVYYVRFSLIGMTIHCSPAKWQSDNQTGFDTKCRRTRPDSNRRPNAPQAFALSKLCNESEKFGKFTLNLDCY